MKILIKIMLSVMILPLLTVSACKASDTDKTSVKESAMKQVIKSISPSDAYKLMEDESSNPPLVILDIRTMGEYQQAHIKDSVLIDYYQSSFRDEVNKLDRNSRYIVYCATAGRSGSAMRLFKQMGFSEVYNLSGGISLWYRQGFPIVQ
jgi:rhodanese-related sulfurtransferase